MIINQQEGGQNISDFVRTRQWRAEPEIFQILSTARARGSGSCILRTGTCFMLFFFIFASFRLKNKGNEGSPCRPAH